MVCPFHDEFVLHPVSTATASVDGVRDSGAKPAMRQRGIAPIERRPEDGTVTHSPLYFEDPFEDMGSDDGQFAWTGEDYLQLAYWRARFLLNAVFYPVSAVVTPPWTVMASDGKLNRRAWGEDHDAERSASSSPCPKDADEGHETPAGGG